MIISTLKKNVYLLVAIGGVLLIVLVLGLVAHFRAEYLDQGSDVFEKVAGPKTTPVEVAHGAAYGEPWILYAYRLVADKDSVCLDPQVTAANNSVDLEHEEPICNWDPDGDDMGDFELFNTTNTLDNGNATFVLGPLRENVTRVMIRTNNGKVMEPEIVALPKDVGAPKAFIMTMTNGDALRIIAGTVTAYDAQGRKVPIGPPHL